MILMRVDLPAPLSPSRPTISFLPTWKSTSRRAVTSPNVLEMRDKISRSEGSIESLPATLGPRAHRQQPDRRVVRLLRPPVSARGTGRAQGADRWSCPPRKVRPDRARVLPHFLLRQRREEVDVVFVDKPAARVDVESRQSIRLGQANLQDGMVALEPGLLVVHWCGPAVPHRRH